MKKELAKGDKVTIRGDRCYPKLFGKQGVIIQKDVMLYPDWCIVEVGTEIHALQLKQLIKI